MIDIIQKRNIYLPSKLYKYRSINDNQPLEKNMHIDALKNEQAYLSNPYFFNDPYDSAFNMDMERFKEVMIKNIEEKVKEQILQKELDKVNIDIKQVKNKEIIYEDINIKNIGILRGLFDDKRDFFYNEYLKAKIKFKVCCFSEKNDSILMWSHYSNNHEGFCIGYDTSKIEEKIKNEFYPVFYHEILFPLVKTEDEINNGRLNSLIKFKDWNYENEWRLILNEEYVSLKPSKIYLGARFNDEHLDYFKDIASEKKCKLYKMHMDYSEYKLKETEIKL